MSSRQRLDEALVARGICATRARARDAVLRLGAAMRQDMWEKQSDGIQMRVIVEHAAGPNAVHAAGGKIVVVGGDDFKQTLKACEMRRRLAR